MEREATVPQVMAVKQNGVGAERYTNFAFIEGLTERVHIGVMGAKIGFCARTVVVEGVMP
jgi:hypothetical protein